MGCLASIAPGISVLLFFVISISISIHSAVVLYALIDFLSMGSADNITHMAPHGPLSGAAGGAGLLPGKGRKVEIF